MNKKCPQCGKIYTELETYCTKCGMELKKLPPNMCSKKKTALCARRVYADDDIYCAYCGSLTEYAKKI